MRCLTLINSRSKRRWLLTSTGPSGASTFSNHRRQPTQCHANADADADPSATANATNLKLYQHISVQRDCRYMASFWEETKLAAQELFGKNETKLLKKRVHVRFDALICCISHCTTLPSPPSVHLHAWYLSSGKGSRTSLCAPTPDEDLNNRPSQNPYDPGPNGSHPPPSTLRVGRQRRLAGHPTSPSFLEGVGVRALASPLRPPFAAGLRQRWWRSPAGLEASRARPCWRELACLARVRTRRLGGDDTFSV